MDQADVLPAGEPATHFLDSLSGPVGRGTIDEHDLGVRSHRWHPADGGFDVPDLVAAGDDDAAAERPELRPRPPRPRHHDRDRVQITDERCAGRDRVRNPVERRKQGREQQPAVHLLHREVGELEQAGDVVRADPVLAGGRHGEAGALRHAKQPLQRRVVEGEDQAGLGGADGVQPVEHGGNIEELADQVGGNDHIERFIALDGLRVTDLEAHLRILLAREVDHGGTEVDPHPACRLERLEQVSGPTAEFQDRPPGWNEPP